MKERVIGIFLAASAELFYSLSTTLTKLLMKEVSPVFIRY